MKEVIDDGSQRMQPHKRLSFIEWVSEIYSCLVAICCCFKYILGEQEDRCCTHLLEDMIFNFIKLVCNKSVKIQYLHSYLNHLLEELGDISEKYGERIHHYIKSMESKYQG